MITMSSMLELEGWRRWRIIAVGLAVFLAGCSMLRLAYNQADTLLYWKLDAYVEFTPQQAPQVRAAIADWFEWHRRSELPDYAALMGRAADEALHDTTSARTCAWLAEMDLRFERAAQQALPAAAAIGALLDAAQLDRLEARQAEQAAEWREEFLHPEAPARRAAALTRLRERAEQLYGPLELRQLERLERGVADSPFDAARWLDERMRRQQALAAALRQIRHEAPPGPDGMERLQSLWRDAMQTPDADYRRHAQELLTYNCTLAAEFHNAATAEQRRAAQRQLKAWQADLLRLAAPA
jgi:hypothetical protein